jgi:dihydrofolate reductase
MRKLVFQMNVSLDGFADHTVTVADDELHWYFARLLDDVDVALFGRKTYRLMADYWPRVRDDPEATPAMIAFGDKFNAMPKMVFSRTLAKAEWNNTRLVRENAVDEVVRLKTQPGKNLSLGGISTCREFMRLGLVDECWLLVQPVIVGKGRRLFEDAADTAKVNLLEAPQTLGSGVVVLHYAFERP